LSRLRRPSSERRMMERVGIVVPTLGARPTWLADAVRSVEQQGDDIDLVIVAPPEAVPSLREQFPGRLVIGEAEKGIVPAIERGWEALKECAIVSWLGDDDRLTERSVEIARRCLEAHPDAAMVYGDYEHLNERDEHRVTVRPGHLAIRWLRLGQNFISQPGSLYRRAAITETGGLSRTLHLAFDVQLHARLGERGAVYCPHLLAQVRIHPGRLTISEQSRSRAEIEEAVWGPEPRALVARALARGKRLWTVGGRVYYRFRRTY